MFRRHRHEMPGLNMSSMPDLIFTVLFFFMIVTHMRSVPLKVAYQVPAGTELTKLTRKSAVTYIYNLDNNKLFEKYTYSERFAVYLIKRMGKLYTYYKNDFIMRDSYSRKYQEIGNNSEYDLLETLQNKNQVLSMSDTHKSNDLSSICYAILEELSKTPNYPIKKCQNCGMYFIPTTKSDEIYCDYPKENSKACRELGAFQSYTERLKQNKAMGEYRRTYQQKFMQVRKDKENRKLVKDFETWKKQAKEKINDMKKGKLTENEVYQWILKNK